MLTDEQRAAVESTAKRTLTIAGAGSGKTRVLCHRVKHLIERGVSPHNIMVLTFTRKAAGEMIERLDAMLPDKGTDGLIIGTFHSVALNILRADGDKLGYSPKSLTVASDDDVRVLIDHVGETLGYLRRPGKGWCAGMSEKRVLAFRDGFYNTGEYPPERESNLGQSSRFRTKAPVDIDLKRILTEYHAQLFNMNMLDFGMILIECRRLLREHADVRERWSKRIRHVLVDEAQDCDTVQYDLHEFFAPPADLFMVGDRRQAIYKWRGAAPHLMTERNPGAEIIDLCSCFRCGPLIVLAANTLIAHNNDPLAKPMVSMIQGCGPPLLLPGRSADICAHVAGLREGGHAWSDIAVLARTRKTLRRLSTLMKELEIPHHVVGSRFYVCSTQEFARLHAALRLVVNPRDRLAFMRLGRDFGMSAGEIGRCIYATSDDPVTTFFGIEGRKADALVDLFSTISAARETPLPFGGLVEVLRAALPCAMDAAVAFWVDAHEQENFQDTDEALRWFALRDSQDDLTTADEVTLSTIHGAKGLEWPVVIVAECNEGSLPSGRSKKPEELLEERRVAYVAFTRAQERLIVHYRRKEDQAQGPGRRISKPSRFIAEAGLKESLDATS